MAELSETTSPGEQITRRPGSRHVHATRSRRERGLHCRLTRGATRHAATAAPGGWPPLALPPPLPGTLRERARKGNLGETITSPLHLPGRVAIPQGSSAIAIVPVGGRPNTSPDGGGLQPAVCVRVWDNPTRAAALTCRREGRPRLPLRPSGPRRRLPCAAAASPCPRPFRRRSLATATRRGRDFRSGGSGAEGSPVARETQSEPRPASARGRAARRRRRPSCLGDRESWAVFLCSGLATTSAQTLGSHACEGGEVRRVPGEAGARRRP